MLDFLHWTLTLALALAAGCLWRELRARRPPEWLLDLDQEDLVTRAELEQFHLRVVQLSRTQRDLLQAKLEETFRMTPRDPEQESAHCPSEPPVPLPQTPGSHQDPPSQTSVSAPILPSVGLAPDPSPATCFEVEESMEALGDPTTRALSLFREGKTIDQIAQELRIGRQEAQLLIRMAHRKAATLAGT